MQRHMSSRSTTQMQQLFSPGTPSSITQITAGTMAIATLRTPIVWDQDLDSEQQPQRFGLQLTQPLLAADGDEAPP